MATRRKKASTRVRARQVVRPKAKARPAKARPVKKRPPVAKKKAPVAPKGKSTAQGKARARRKPKPRGKAVRSAGKAKKPPKRRVVRRKVVTPEKAFQTLLKKSKRKLAKPRYTRRSGRSLLRGVDKSSRERTIMVGAFWEDVREGWLEAGIMRAFETMFASFKRPPTMYVRFTFAVSNVHELLTGGSPKLVRATKKKLTQWFQNSGLSYTLDGARFQLQRAFDDVADAVKRAISDSSDAKFFLRFVTMVAYVVA